MEKIWKIYKYIYYREYSWHKKMFGKSDVPEESAMLGMSFSALAIILSIITLLHILFNFNIDFTKSNTTIKAIALAILIGVIHYFLFIYKKRYLKIEEEFINENLNKRKKYGWYVLTYSIGSILLYIGLLFLGIWLKNNNFLPLING